VVCFDADGRLLAGSAMAWRLLGLNPEEAAPSDEEPVLAAVRDAVDEGGEAHIEVGGRLMFVMRRSFRPDEGDRAVAAYVIYDMSRRREQFVDSLDREFFEAHYRGAGRCLALLKSSVRPGAVYGAVKGAAEAFAFDKKLVQPVDAYTCACVFREGGTARARAELKRLVSSLGWEDMKLSLVPVEDTGDASPSRHALDRAYGRLEPLASALLPRLVVLEPYQPVFETLDLLLEDVAELVHCTGEREARERLESGDFSGFILDVDSFPEPSVRELILTALERDERLRGVLMTTRRADGAPDWLRSRPEVGVLGKPFEADEAVRAIRRQFDLS